MVSAPEDATSETVLYAVKQRGRWIYEQLRDFRQQLEHVTLRKYISGESHYYLGKQYLLKVHVEPDQVQGVKLLRGKLEVSVRASDATRVKNLLIDWYKNTRQRSVCQTAGCAFRASTVGARTPIHSYPHHANPMGQLLT